MRRYSATEAIGPAWERTKQILRAEKRILFTLKICVVMVIASFGSLVSLPNFTRATRQRTMMHANGVASTTHPMSLHTAFLLSLIFLLLSTVLFYFGSRLQMMMVNCVATRQTTLAPLWHKYAPGVWRWMSAKLVLSVVLIAVSAATMLPYLRLMRGGSDNLAGVIAAGGLASVSALIAVIIYALYWLIKDFLLPPIVLENASLVDALNRAAESLRGQASEVILYMLLRVVLYFALAIAGYIFAVVLAFVSAIPLGLVGAVLYFGLHKAGTVGAVLLSLLGILAAAVLAAWFLVLLVLIFGTLFTFMQAHSLYFYGGRYALLGQILEPADIYSSYTPPPSLPTDDDSSGPDFPLNPELAT